ncbi:MAG: hypothetical protein L6R39_004204 [Caloplaca ligustica]|nr:MAG: hypothetical protein L6R39_004204 [Caloplaca ligustica]
MVDIPSLDDEAITRKHTLHKTRTSKSFSSPPPPPPPSYNKRGKAASTSPVPRGAQNVIQKDGEKLDLRRKKHLGKELVWLQDPLKLAENTVSLLRDDEDEKALEIVRMASKRAPCTVSWNHLIDYEMSKGRCQKAVKIYNENPYLER